MKFFSLLKKVWPQFFLFLLVSLLLYLNFNPGTYLTGWDNLQVELDLEINLERAFNVSWQEYQGLGLLGGMGHGADLVRQIILWPFSLILKANWLRYFWNYATLLSGVWGAYALFVYLLKNNKQARLLAFLGAGFYLMNLGTVQNFYVTFEPFVAFFAFFPWLIYYFLSYLERSNKKNLLGFIAFSLLGTIFGYVQTVFVVYLLILLMMMAFFLLKKKITWKKAGLILLVVFLTNAFWLLPVAYFTIFASATTLSAKINLMSTEVTFLKNNQYGSFANLVTLKGFWLDYTDFNQWGNNVYLMDAWKTHLNKPWVVVLTWFYFVLLVIGIVSLFMAKKSQSQLRHSHLAILLVFLFTAFILAGSNPPLAFLFDFLRQVVPLFGQIFRSAFTKWIVPYSLFYSLLLTFGLAFIFSLFKKKLWQFLLAAVFFLSLIFYSLPSFTGNFFYSRLRVNIPDAYFQLFDYFKHEAPQSSRITNLPQHSFYAWQWNDWGYRGSGFIWYGIRQPILDRAFDVWSESSERYYWQLQAALDKKDTAALENVLAEYDVDYLLLDESTINRNTTKPFNYQAMKEFLLNSEKIELIEEFDFISLYTFTDQNKQTQQDFISLYRDLPSVANDYRFAWSDQAFADFGHYLTINNDSVDVIYPFPALFSNHWQKDLEFLLSEDESYFYLTSLKTNPTVDFQLQLADLLKTESRLPFRLTWSVENNTAKLNFRFLAPEIIESEQVTNFKLEKNFVFDARLCLAGEACLININDQLITQLTESGEIDLLLNTSLPNTIALSSNQSTTYFDYAFFDLSLYNLEIERQTRQGDNRLTVKIPKVILQSNILDSELNVLEPVNCRSLQGGFVAKERWDEGAFYQAVGTSVCDHFYLPDLDHSHGYLIKIDAQNLASLPATFAVQVDSLGRSPLETYLSEGVNYQVLPPTESFNQGYTLYFSTDSYGKEINENLLKSVELFFWPYNFLKELHWQNSESKLAQNQPTTSQLADCGFIVNKKALWLYQVDLTANCEAKYLSFTQAYDRGWLAYQDGQKLEHFKLNNWANAWLLDEQDLATKIYIFYWPQLLQYFGFLLAVISFIVLFINYQKKQSKRLREKRVG
ncbi:MAG: hypothetical protein GX943_01390 [Candidatus Pacebacteria bacterium]|nr:hypothetical protein [Candidatus Paceibacterota bacterium]